MKYFVGLTKCVAVIVIAFVISTPSTIVLAADYTIVPRVSAAFTPGTFTPVPLPPISPPNTVNSPGTPLVYQVDFYINASGFNAGADQRGFGNITFDIARTAGLGNTSIPGWQANGALIDANGAPPPGATTPLWDTNSDFGPLDLQDIVASIAVIPTPDINDPRPHVGEAPSLAATNLIGSVFVDWNGLGIQTLTAKPENPSFAHANGATSLDPLDGGLFKFAGQFERDLNATLHNGVVVFTVPEPSTIVLIGMVIPTLGLLAIRARRKNA